MQEFTENLHNMHRHFNKLALALFIYDLIFQGIAMILYGFGSGFVASDGFSLTQGGILGIIFLLVFLGHPDFESRHEHFGPACFLIAMLAMYGLQLLSSCLTSPVESLLRFLGFTLSWAENAANGPSEDAMTLLYTILGAPIIEEIVFRGFVYSWLRKYGQIFASGVSALFFGLMHGNILQFMAAFLIGLLFALLRERYGIHASLLLHITNNLLSEVFNDFSSPVLNTVYSMLVIGGVIVLLIELFRMVLPKRRFAEKAAPESSEVPKAFPLDSESEPMVTEPSDIQNPDKDSLSEKTAADTLDPESASSPSGSQSSGIRPNFKVYDREYPVRKKRNRFEECEGLDFVTCTFFSSIGVILLIIYYILLALSNLD